MDFAMAELLVNLKKDVMDANLVRVMVHRALGWGNRRLHERLITGHFSWFGCWKKNGHQSRRRTWEPGRKLSRS